MFYKWLGFLLKLHIVGLVQCPLVAALCRLVLHEWVGYSVPGLLTPTTTPNVQPSMSH